MIFTSEDGKQCLRILPDVVISMTTEASKLYPLETGGILLGYYNSSFNTATVCFASAPPPDSKHGRTSFKRGVEGVDELLSWGHMQSPSLYYVGEWHTHPDGSAKPSISDIIQMNWSALNLLYKSSSPILVILGGEPKTAFGWHASVHKAWRRYVSLKPL